MSIPEFLYNKLNKQYGDDLTNKIIDGFNQERYTTLRVNTLKSNINDIEVILKNNNIFICIFDNDCIIIP